MTSKKQLLSKKLKEESNVLENHLKIIESFKDNKNNNKPVSLLLKDLNINKVLDLNSKIITNKTNNKEINNDTLKVKYNNLRNNYESKMKEKELEKLQKLQNNIIKKANKENKNSESNKDNKITSVKLTNKPDSKLSSRAKTLLKNAVIENINNDKININENKVDNNSKNNDNIKSNSNNEDIDVLEKNYFSSLKTEKKKEVLFKYLELFDFLKKIKLSRYIYIFVDNDIIDIESLINKISDNFLLDNGFSQHSIVSINNSIKQLLTNNENITKINKDNNISNTNSLTTNTNYNIKNNLIKIEDESCNDNFSCNKNIEDNNKNNVIYSCSYNTKENILTSTDEENKISFLPLNKKKTNCYNCVKTIVYETSIKKSYDLGLLKEKVVMINLYYFILFY